MKEKPILFSTPMVQVILDGRKTMTRRIMKPQPWVFNAPDNGPEDPAHEEWNWPIPNSRFKGEAIGMTSDPLAFHKYCPYGKPSDVLWVRETAVCVGGDYEGNDIEEGFWIYKADGEKAEKHLNVYDHLGEGWKPSIFMPRVACRLFLEIVSVKVERLQDITEHDAKAEGVESMHTMHYVPDDLKFHMLWDRIHGYKSWAANPWVWVIEFKRITRPNGK